MDKRIISTLVILFFSQPLWADTCPSVENIRASGFSGWTAYDSDDGKPLSAKRSRQFKSHIEQFALAEWLPEHNSRHTIRCYYRDKNGSELEAYLQKSNLVPESQHAYWYPVSGSMHCAAGMSKCQFNTSIAQQTQLAKK